MPDDTFVGGGDQIDENGDFSAEDIMAAVKEMDTATANLERAANRHEEEEERKHEDPDSELDQLLKELDAA